MRKHGPNKIRDTVYRYGAPPAICALDSLLEQEWQKENEQKRWRIYVADASCRLVHLWSKNSKMPYYSSLIEPNKPKKDGRAGKEIVDSIVRRRRKKRIKEVKAKNETV